MGVVASAWQSPLCALADRVIGDMPLNVWVPVSQFREPQRAACGSSEILSTYQHCSRGGCGKGGSGGGRRLGLSDTRSHPEPVTFSPTNTQAWPGARPTQQTSQEGSGPRLLVGGAVAGFTSVDGAQPVGMRVGLGA